MTIQVEGLHDRTLREFVGRKLRALTRHLRTAPIDARIHFTEINGPKGGLGTRCGINLDWPHHPALHVEEVGVSARYAFDEALANLERRLGREVQQARDQRRRPKKYYVAKQQWTSKLA